VGCGVNGGNPDRNILTYVTSFNRTSWKSLWRSLQYICWDKYEIWSHNCFVYEILFCVMYGILRKKKQYTKLRTIRPGRYRTIYFNILETMRQFVTPFHFFSISVYGRAEV
jgi:hypothetical protein